MNRREPAANGQVDLAKRFGQISEDLLAEPEEEPTLERIVRTAIATIPSASVCSVTLRHADGTLETPVCTSPLGRKLDDLQHELGEGPCLDAIWTMDTNVIEDTRTETRWPSWCQQAAALGVISALGVRIETSTEVIGALNLTSGTAGAFDHTDIAIASIFARHAANALAVSQQLTTLHAALQTRQAIGVAQGLLMQRYGLTLDQAFEVLRRYSQDRNIKLRDVARQLVRVGRILDGLVQTLEDGDDSGP